MSIRNTTHSYGSVAKFFHWTIFILLVGMLIYGYLLEDVPKAYQGFAFNTHKIIGLTILLLMLLRLLWRSVNPKPALIYTHPWERFVERLVHGLLYLVIIAMPLMGLIGSVAGGRPPHLGNIIFTLPIAPNKNLSSFAFYMHNTIALVIIALICIHVLAALFHYFVRKDQVLQRMLPHHKTSLSDQTPT